ncbi:MAG TPA: UDP-2,3-diacylglucosamine diphosphatase LpxI [Limnochordales bacterium]
MAGAIGLIAGRGELPAIFLQQAARRGLEVVLVELDGAAVPPGRRGELARLRVDLAGWPELVQFFLRHGVRDVYVAGKVSRLQAAALLEQAAAGELAQLYRRGSHLGDQALCQLVADELARVGLRLGEQREVLADLLMPAGLFSARAPDAREARDLERGKVLAQRLAELDVGQTVVLKHGVVLAAEASAEGTDATIRRGGRLGGPGAVVVKAARPDQDLRLDTPVVGPATVRAMAAVGASCLGVQAGRCFVLHPQRVRRAADRAGIAVVGW